VNRRIRRSLKKQGEYDEQTKESNVELANVKEIIK